MLDIKEVAKLHSVWSTYYPSALKGDRDIHTDRWMKAFQDSTFDEVREAIEKLSNEWNDTYEPPFAQLIKYVEAEANKNEGENKKRKRRIITSEEELAAMYEQITEKLANNELPGNDKKLSEEAIDKLNKQAKTLKPFYDLFNGEGWQYRYAKHFKIENRPFFQSYKKLKNGLELYLSEHSIRDDYENY